MHRLQALDEPLPPLPDVRGARVIRAVGEPQRYIAAACTLADLHGIDQMIECGLPRSGIGAAKRSVFVDLILKGVRVDCADADPGNVRPRASPTATSSNPVREIPENMNGQRWTAARHGVAPAARRRAFLAIVTAAPGCRNFPNRVPVFANPQLGSSMRKVIELLEDGIELGTRNRPRLLVVPNAKIGCQPASHFILLFRATGQPMIVTS